PRALDSARSPTGAPHAAAPSARSPPFCSGGLGARRAWLLVRRSSTSEARIEQSSRWSPDRGGVVRVARPLSPESITADLVATDACMSSEPSVSRKAQRTLANRASRKLSLAACFRQARPLGRARRRRVRYVHGTALGNPRPPRP